MQSLIKLLNLPKSEQQKIRRYIIVGIGATLIHLGVAHLALPYINNVLKASFGGFSVAFAASYLGHKFYTFSDAISGSAVKFFTVTFSSFLISLIFLSQLQAFSPPLALTISVIIIPVINYILSRFWVFKFND